MHTLDYFFTQNKKIKMRLSADLSSFYTTAKWIYEHLSVMHIRDNNVLGER